MPEEQCPYCSYAPSHLSARQAVNKHLKYFASRPLEKRGPHPSLSDPEFRLIAIRRGFRTLAKDEEEKISRRATSQRTYKLKRRERAMDSVRMALVQLR